MADISCGLGTADLSNPRLRLASIFIMFAASGTGALAPIILAQGTKCRPAQELAFSICKYIGTGVIIATAWLHLLVPAAEKLADVCLGGRLGTYPWAFAIGLWTVLFMFFIEMLAKRLSMVATQRNPNQFYDPSSVLEVPNFTSDATGSQLSLPTSASGDEHKRYGHHDEQKAIETTSQLLVIAIPEVGTILHSFFVGLTLGTTNDFIVLLVVLVFHQILTGLGLGARLALAPWSRRRRRILPYLLAGMFALGAPTGVATGLGSRPQDADIHKLADGVFSAISAGILMYSGLVELLAREFLFESDMHKASFKRLGMAFGGVAFGIAAMSLLAIWEDRPSDM